MCGINVASVQKRLLAEGDKLTLANALTIAQSMEIAVQDSKELSLSTPLELAPVHQLPRIRPRHTTPSTGSVATKTPCYCCGETGHLSSICRYKNETCFAVGHVKRVCRRSNKKSHRMSKRLPVHKVSDQASEEDSNQYSLMVINTMCLLLNHLLYLSHWIIAPSTWRSTQELQFP